MLAFIIPGALVAGYIVALATDWLMGRSWARRVPGGPLAAGIIIAGVLQTSLDHFLLNMAAGAVAGLGGWLVYLYRDPTHQQDPNS